MYKLLTSVVVQPLANVVQPLANVVQLLENIVQPPDRYLTRFMLPLSVQPGAGGGRKLYRSVSEVRTFVNVGKASDTFLKHLCLRTVTITSRLQKKLPVIWHTYIVYNIYMPISDIQMYLT